MRFLLILILILVFFTMLGGVWYSRVEETPQRHCRGQTHSSEHHTVYTGTAFHLRLSLGNQHLHDASQQVLITDGGTGLPSWVVYSTEGGLVGVPLREDRGLYTFRVTDQRNCPIALIHISVLHDAYQENVQYAAAVSTSNLPVNLPRPRGTPAIWATVVVQKKPKAIEAEDRLQLINTLGDYLRLSPTTVKLLFYRGSSELLKENITIWAQGGLSNFSTALNGEALELLWPVDHHVDTEQLSDLSRILQHGVTSQSLATLLCVQVLGWRVLLRAGGSPTKRSPRHLRQTPMPTVTLAPPTWQVYHLTSAGHTSQSAWWKPRHSEISPESETTDVHFHTFLEPSHVQQRTEKMHPLGQHSVFQKQVLDTTETPDSTFHLEISPSKADVPRSTSSQSSLDPLIIHRFSLSKTPFLSHIPFKVIEEPGASQDDYEGHSFAIASSFSACTTSVTKGFDHHRVTSSRLCSPVPAVESPQEMQNMLSSLSETKELKTGSEVQTQTPSMDQRSSLQSYQTSETMNQVSGEEDYYPLQTSPRCSSKESLEQSQRLEYSMSKFEQSTKLPRLTSAEDPTTAPHVSSIRDLHCPFLFDPDPKVLLETSAAEIPKPYHASSRIPSTLEQEFVSENTHSAVFSDHLKVPLLGTSRIPSMFGYCSDSTRAHDWWSTASPAFESSAGRTGLPQSEEDPSLESSILERQWARLVTTYSQVEPTVLWSQAEHGGLQWMTSRTTSVLVSEPDRILVTAGNPTDQVVSVPNSSDLSTAVTAQEDLSTFFQWSPKPYVMQSEVWDTSKEWTNDLESSLHTYFHSHSPHFSHTPQINTAESSGQGCSAKADSSCSSALLDSAEEHASFVRTTEESSYPTHVQSPKIRDSSPVPLSPRTVGLSRSGSVVLCDLLSWCPVATGLIGPPLFTQTLMQSSRTRGGFSSTLASVLREEIKADVAPSLYQWTTPSITSDSVNKPPAVMQTIPPMVATIGFPFQHTISSRVFTDPEEGSADHLSVKLLLSDGSPCSVGSWLVLDGLQLHGLPLEVDLWFSPQLLVLVAYDSGGLSAQTSFTVRLERSLIQPCHSFTLVVQRSLYFLLINRRQVELLVRKLARFFTDGEGEHLVVLSLKPGSSVVTWYNVTLCQDVNGDTCSADQIQSMWSAMSTADAKVRPEFRRAMLPEFPVSKVSQVRVWNNCLPKTTELTTSAETTTSVFQTGNSQWVTRMLTATLVICCVILFAVLIEGMLCRLRVQRHTLWPGLSFGHLVDRKVLKPRNPPLFQLEVPPPPLQLWPNLIPAHNELPTSTEPKLPQS